MEEVLGRTLSRAARPYAHTPPTTSDHWHLWADHAVSVGSLAGQFGAPFGAEKLCRLIGLTHDAGKLTEDVQRALRLRAVDHGPRLGKPHKAEGAALAGLLFEAGNLPAAHVMALANFGHHSHIPNRTHPDPAGITRFMRRNPRYLNELIRTIEAHTDVDLHELAAAVELPSWVEKPSHLELFTRMCHSALVDADFLDTEAHFRSLPRPRLAEPLGMTALLSTFEAAYERRYGERSPGDMSELDQIRRTVFDRARIVGAEEPINGRGIYRLPAPTGCGKTMSAAEFALTHAARFGKRRVIVAVPFTSITTQNAEAYRQAFAAVGDEVVLEHHSNILDESIADNEWRRFSATNWDAEFIVTTTVQLLESLFSNRPSATRKLHRLVDSVVVIDEVQALPIDLLPAILRMFKELSAHLGVTILLASATQPAFWSLDEWRDLGMTDVMPTHDAPPITERVTYEVRDAKQTWEDIADEVSTLRQALVVVNTTSDAQQLHALLADSAAPEQRVLHLSTRMYNQHRADVLAEVRQLLEGDAPILLVSTQLIEAGVDIDFPVVWRALAPADSIVQSAGRCNREGRLGVRAGRVVVFQPIDGGTPPGAYARATTTTRNLFIEQAARADQPHTLGGPASMEVYYRYLYAERLNNSTSVTGTEVNRYREALAFEDTNRAFHMIEDTSVAVIVENGSDSPELGSLVDRLREATYILTRDDRRLLNRFTANAPRRGAQSQPGLIEQLPAGPVLWAGEYSEQIGLILQNDPGAVIW